MLSEPTVRSKLQTIPRWYISASASDSRYIRHFCGCKNSSVSSVTLSIFLRPQAFHMIYVYVSILFFFVYIFPYAHTLGRQPDGQSYRVSFVLLWVIVFALIVYRLVCFAFSVITSLRILK